IGHHAEERWTRPAGDPQRNQGNAGHVRNRYGDASKLLAKLTDQRGSDQQRKSRDRLADGREYQRAFHRLPASVPVFLGSDSSMGSGSGAAVGPSSALACAGSFTSGWSLNVSLCILPVNLNGGS